MCATKRAGKRYSLAEERANDKALNRQWTWQAPGTARSSMAGGEAEGVMAQEREPHPTEVQILKVMRRIRILSVMTNHWGIGSDGARGPNLH